MTSGLKEYYFLLLKLEGLGEQDIMDRLQIDR